MLFIMLASPLLAQKNEIVSTAGDAFATEAGYLSFTLGEVAIETLPASPQKLTQGFHQPVLFVRKAASAAETKHLVSVFPNPVSAMLYMESRPREAAGRYTVLDMRGVTVRQGTVMQRTEVSFDDLPPGTYTLQVKTTSTRMQSFKIVKHP